MPHPTPPIEPRKTTLRTALQRRLRQMLPTTSFPEPLESRFRQWYAGRVRWRMRSALWLTMGNILLVMLVGSPLLQLRHQLFGNEHDALLTIVGLALFFTSAATLLVLARPGLYRRYYDSVAQIVSPTQAICFALLDVLARKQGYSLSAWMPLVVIGPYFLLGLMQAQAVRSSVLALLAYAVAMTFSDVSVIQGSLDVAIAAFASVLGAAVHFSLQRSVRHGYLQTQTMNESAHRDSLTGIHNRRMFDEQMKRVWQQASRENVPIALLLIDLDHFKAFNDTHGHQGGDTCLAKVAALLPQVARRPLDLAARYGGEEFVILLYDVKRPQVEEVCIQLHASLEYAAIAHEASATGVVTFSIGAACVEPRANRHAEGLIQLADEALYAAKERGRNRTVIMDREYETLRTGAFRVGRREQANV